MRYRSLAVWGLQTGMSE